MKRRDVLKRLAQFAAGVTLARCATAAPTPDSARLETVRRMVTETPAQGWPSRSGHGSTLVYFGDGPAFEVSFKRGRPNILERPLTVSEHSDLAQEQRRVDPYIPQRVGTVMGDGKWRLRGWIYNGRHSDAWNMSAEPL